MNLAEIVQTYDRLTRRDGFHVLHDWDGKADAVNINTIPVDVVDYLVDKSADEGPDTTSLAILLDYYFLYVLALLSMRVWDEGNADENLERVNRLLQALQGPAGSGQRFAANAETLILLATSHYELRGEGYEAMLERARSLSPARQRDLALVHAAALGGHLRFGFDATYGRDTLAARKDNQTDYPWLCLALATLLREYSRLHEDGALGDERDIVVEAILNGLSADAGGFVAERRPASLAASDDDWSEVRDLLGRYRRYLVEEFERQRPSDQAYSPLSFVFNFSQNVVKGAVVDAALWGEAWNLTLNDMLTGIPRDASNAKGKERLARTLMAHARSRPERIRGRPMPAIVYDPASGLRTFAGTLRLIRQ